ncbi:MAG: GC-type dockerin domain-anchored protein [Phycisphaerales bacterium]|jgi:hypothetical protein|nr:GC-type dockerin domain-anchored protein [Phycisphaerales bacterium]
MSIRAFLTAVVLSLGVSPVLADTIHDEAVDGDLSTLASSPTPLSLSVGGNTIIGTVNFSNNAAGDRDFFTITVPDGQEIEHVNLLAWSPADTGFIALNSGATGFVPGVATNGSFLAGAHITPSRVGGDLLFDFVFLSVTTNSLSEQRLGPGTYTFVIQQTSNIVSSYTLEFVLSAPQCPGDWDNSGGQPDSSDFLAYLNDFAAQDPAADLAPMGGNGVFDSSDFLEFLNLYSAGC